MMRDYDRDEQKKRKSIRFAGSVIAFDEANNLEYARTGADIRLDTVHEHRDPEQWSATPNGRLDVAVDAFECLWAYGATPQAAASKLDSMLHRRFRALAKRLGYEVTG